MNKENNKIYDDKEASDYIGITVGSLYDLRDSGWFKPCGKKDGKPIFYKWQLDAVKEKLENVSLEQD